MRPIDFFFQLFILTTICTLILFAGVHQLDIFHSDQYLSIIAMVTFTIYTIGLYFLSSLSVRSPNKGMFTAVHIGTIFFKMVLTIGIAMFYRNKYEPDAHYYILPFIMIYVVYTAFETYMMMKVSKS